MKSFKKSTLVIIAIVAFIVSSAFTAKHIEEAQIKTSAVCGMCENTMKKALMQINGIKEVSLNVENGVLSVKYDPHKVKLEDIRVAITKTGYDADELPADAEAYEKLHGCCKKDSVH